MSTLPPNPEPKLLPGIEPHPDPAARPTPTRAVRQLQDLPKDELQALAEEFGLDPVSFRSRQHLVAALHDRRHLIANLDRDAMLDCVRWGRRPVSLNASNEQLAQEIVRIKSMRFDGLSHQGLLVLARLRGADPHDADDIPTLVHKLKRLEGFFTKLNRKRRSLLGSLVSNILGDDETPTDYQFLPPQQTTTDTPSPTIPPPRPASIKQEIEESGLLGGIAGRIKKSADSYLNQKLDEIESRIDRKLDEIDRRLGEWRDKEIANRIRILKITLWASVIVAAISLIYSYIKVYIVG